MRISVLVMLCAALVAAGCRATPSTEVLPLLDVADPAVVPRDPQYVPVLGGYQPRKVVGPDDWRQLNDRLSPAGRGAGS